MTEPRTPNPSSGDEPTQPSSPGIPPSPGNTPPAAPPPEPPPAVPPPAAGSGPESPPVAWEPGSGTPPARPRSRRGQILAVVLAVAAAIAGAVGVRFLGQQAGSLLGTTFAGGEVWNRLPAAARDDFERRIKAVAGDLESMSNAEASRQVQSRVQAGMRRLDDATLVKRLSLQTAALAKIDDAACGEFAQASFAGRPQPETTAEKLMAAMSETELTEWFNVAVLALEAEARKSPEPRTVTDAETDPLFERLLGSLDQPSLEAVQKGADPGATPAEACLGVRTLYDAIERLPDEDKRLIALADVTL